MAEQHNDVDRLKSLINKGFAHHFNFQIKHLIFLGSFPSNFHFICHTAVASSEKSPSIFASTKDFLVKLESEITASPNKVKQVLRRPDLQCDMALLEAEISFEERKIAKK